jgi:DNA-binding MarR family transcriptional regulator
LGLKDHGVKAQTALQTYWCICNNVAMSASAVDQIVDDCLAVRVRLIGRAVTAIYDGALDGHGLTIAQLNLLAALGKAGPCSPSTLGDVLQLERSTVSRNLNLLLRHGWVEAVSSDAKGIREVTLTRAGRSKIDSVLPHWRKAQREAAKLLGTEAVTAVRGIASSIGHIPSA